MDAMTENSIRQEQIESFGRLMAGFSHDMKNHLGIIRESNGLMEDILEMSGCGGDEVTVGRLKRSIDSIERRVVIAASMFHHLSGFAHRPDTPHSSFQMNELITEELIFLERFSRLKQVEVDTKLWEGLPAIYNDPSLLQHVLYRVYILCLEQLETGQSLTIMTEAETEAVKITFRLVGNSQVRLDQLFDTHVPAAMEKLEGILKTGETSFEYSEIVIKIPSLSEKD